VGYAGGFLLFLAYVWCVCHNKKVLARDAKILQQRQHKQQLLQHKETAAEEGGPNSEDDD
jgi:hypothetical protein